MLSTAKHSAIQGPAIFLAQFIPLQQEVTLENMLRWAADLGYRGVQIPTWDKRLFDLDSEEDEQEDKKNRVVECDIH